MIFDMHQVCLNGLTVHCGTRGIVALSDDTPPEIPKETKGRKLFEWINEVNPNALFDPRLQIPTVFLKYLFAAFAESQGTFSTYESSA